MFPYNKLVADYFTKDIEILCHCDLIAHDHHWRSLHDVLFPYAGFEFAHHQRLLVLDHDTDYYPDVCSIGNNLYNLIKLFSLLDISTDHVVILTGNYGLEKDVQHLCDQFNLSYPKVIEFSQWYVYPLVTELIDNDIIENFDHLFICLNNVQRCHRKILMAMLYEKKLTDLGIISWRAMQDVQPRLSCKKETTTDTTIGTIPVGYHFRTTDPFARINDDLNLCVDSINLQIKYQLLINQTHIHPLITGKPNQKDTRWTADFFNHALIYLITETVGQYRHVYFSEKTWKAMASKKPFLLMGARNSLTTLKKLGFVTFDTIWDESYDQANTTFERANLITDVLLQLANQDWRDIAQRCRPIIQHNFENLGRLQQIHLNKLQYL